jgi:hypothetical protein
MKDRVAREQATEENIDIPGNKREQGSSASPMEGGIEDANTPMLEADKDS